MRQAAIALSVIAAIALLSSMTRAAPPPAADEQSSRCIKIEPICRVGQRPFCFCENDYNDSKCRWVCGSI